jgi:soluble lytic murein transglycosylase
VKTRTSLIAALLLTGFSRAASASVLESTERCGQLLADGKVAEAAEAARACGEPQCQLILGRALFALGQFDAAAETLGSARPKIDGLAGHAAVLQGESLLFARRIGEALEPLRAAIALDPSGPVGLRASALLADALLAQGDSRAALEQAERAASLAGQPPDVRAGMSWDEAQALLAGDPAHSHAAAVALRDFWLQHPEHPAAEQARAAELSLQAGLPEPTGHELLLRASRLLSAGMPAQATAQVQVAASALTGEARAEALLLYARSLAADGKRGEAGPALEEAAAHGAPHVAAQAGMLLARDRARRGRDAEAQKLAEEVARKYPAAPEAEESVLFVSRLLLDAGQRTQARARLAKLAARRSGPNAAIARWTLAWMSYRDKLHDAAERFAEFTASAGTDEERAQGLYWQARVTGKTELYRRAEELDSLGWYGILARQRLGELHPGDAPFPPLRMTAMALPARRLALALQLASLGLLAESAAEADFFVREHPGDESAAALAVYERARRYDRSLTLAESLLGGRGSRAPRSVLDAAYPAAFPQEIGETATRVGVDPYFLLAVMRRESLFKPDARSAAGAVGLLQLLPATARRAAMVLGRPSLRDEELTVPGTAIDLGAWYLSELLGRFGDPAVALAAYNAGPRIALPWATAGAGRPLDEWVEDIPYRETRRYVKVVAGAWSAYRLLAGGPPPLLSRTVPAPRDGANF